MNRGWNIRKYKWSITVVIQLFYCIAYIKLAELMKYLNESGYITNLLSFIWLICFILTMVCMAISIVRGIKQSILETSYYEQLKELGEPLETTIDKENKHRFSDYGDELQELILSNYSFCLNKRTHEFCLVPLQGIKGRIIRIDNAPTVDDEHYFSKSLYTYIDCSDTDRIRDFCLRNPQVLSFVTVAGDIAPDIPVIRIENMTQEAVISLLQAMQNGDSGVLLRFTEHGENPDNTEGGSKSGNDAEDKTKI